MSQVGNTAGVKFYRAAQMGHQAPPAGLGGAGQELIGYEPNTPFEEGLKKTIAWFKDNWELIAGGGPLWARACPRRCASWCARTAESIKTFEIAI